MAGRRWRRSHVAVFFALATVCGCSANKTTAPMVDQHALIAKLDAVLDKPVASVEDAAFIIGLTPAQLSQIEAYYSEHPRQAPHTASAPNTLPPAREAPPAASTADYAVETVECQWGSGGWHADAAYLSSLCGGAADYMFGYFSIPNAYNERARLTARTTNPTVLLAMAYFGNESGGLSTRVYSGSNHVFTCVGRRIDWLGISPTMWNNAVSIYKR
jgi:hypothetical protein